MGSKKCFLLLCSTNKLVRRNVSAPCRRRSSYLGEQSSTERYHLARWLLVDRVRLEGYFETDVMRSAAKDNTQSSRSPWQRSKRRSPNTKQHAGSPGLAQTLFSPRLVDFSKWMHLTSPLLLLWLKAIKDTWHTVPPSSLLCSRCCCLTQQTSEKVQSVFRSESAVFQRAVL